MPERCFKFGPLRVSVKCEKCGAWPECAHVVGFTGYCPGCCVECHPPSPPDRTGPVAPLVGEQVGGLFE